MSKKRTQSLRSVFLKEDTDFANDVTSTLDMVAGRPDYVRSLRNRLMDRVKPSARPEAERITALISAYSKAPKGPKRDELHDQIVSGLQSMPVEGHERNALALLKEARQSFTLGFEGGHGGPGVRLNPFATAQQQRWPEPKLQEADYTYEMGSYEADQLVQQAADLADKLDEYSAAAARGSGPGDAEHAKQLKRLHRKAQRLAAEIHAVVLGPGDEGAWQF